MQHNHIKAFAFSLLLGLAWTTSAYGTPRELFHIKEENTGIHEEPSATAPVVRHLNKGDRVIEFRRQGSWVKVSQLGAVGEDGWVEISRLAPEPRHWAEYLQQMQQQRKFEAQQRESEAQMRKFTKHQRKLAEQRARKRQRELEWQQKQELYDKMFNPSPIPLKRSHPAP